MPTATIGLTSTRVIAAISDPALACGQPDPIDAVLVIDRSQSMAGPAHDDIKRAAQAFIAHLNLSHDQIGVLTFAAQAHVDQPLTHDPGVIATAIDNIVSGAGSNIAAGVDAAQSELLGARHNALAVPVMIVLSDGRANRGGSVRAAADTAKARHIRIIVVGLGRNVNEELLRELASSPADYHYASSPADLPAIYEAIAEELPECARGSP